MSISPIAQHKKSGFFYNSLKTDAKYLMPNHYFLTVFSYYVYYKK